MPLPQFFLSKPDVLFRIRRTGVRAWLYVTAFFASSIEQATLPASQVQSPYLLGLGESFLALSRVWVLSRLLWYYRNWRYHWVMVSPFS